MKRQLLATVSCLTLTGAASAADIPARMPVKAPPPPVVVQLWAGPYIGINGGVVWHRLETSTTSIAGDPYDSAKVTATGGTLGGTIGYNWQSQNFVFGIEADGNWVGAKETKRQIRPNGVAVDYTAKLDWLATVRGRAGVAFGRTLVFATGGLAVGGVKNSWAFPPPFCAPGACLATNHETRVGWTVGGGIEHFITNPHVTVKAEALYVDLGRETVSGLISNNYTSRFRNNAIVGRLGLNLKW